MRLCLCARNRDEPQRHECLVEAATEGRRVCDYCLCASADRVDTGAKIRSALEQPYAPAARARQRPAKPAHPTPGTLNTTATPPLCPPCRSPLAPLRKGHRHFSAWSRSRRTVASTLAWRSRGLCGTSPRRSGGGTWGRVGGGGVPEPRSRAPQPTTTIALFPIILVVAIVVVVVTHTRPGIHTS